MRPARVLAFQQVLAVCAARDADQDFLKFGWSASAGEFPAGNQSSIVTWKSPPSVGKQTLTVWATDFEDTVSADLEVDVAGVASPESLRFSNGVNVISLNWAGVSDSTIDGWSGYEVFVAPRSMIGLSEAEILPYLVSPSPILLRSSRVTPVEPGNVIYCQVRSRRDYEGVVERAPSGPEISSAVRLDGYAVNAVTGETSPLYEVKSLRGAFGLHVPGGQIEALDPAQRERFDIYIGSSGAEDGPGDLMLKSPSRLAYADPSWSGRVTGIWPLDGDWSTPVPPENPSAQHGGHDRAERGLRHLHRGRPLRKDLDPPGRSSRDLSESPDLGQVGVATDPGVPEVLGAPRGRAGSYVPPSRSAHGSARFGIAPHDCAGASPQDARIDRPRSVEMSSRRSDYAYSPRSSAACVTRLIATMKAATRRFTLYSMLVSRTVRNADVMISSRS